MPDPQRIQRAKGLALGSQWPCPGCGARAGCDVIDTRGWQSPKGFYIRRRRACKDCGHRWTTIEVANTGRGIPPALGANGRRIVAASLALQRALSELADAMPQEDGHA